MELIESLIRAHGGELAQRPSRAGDLDAALGGGGLDLGALLSKLGLGNLAGRTGLGESQASGALETLVPMLLEFLQEHGGGLEGLASALGQTDLGGLLGKAGKPFNR